MSASLAIIWALARKDLLLEVRNREVVVSIAAFAALVLAIFTFAIDLTLRNALLVGPGVLWAAIAFAGVVGLNRAFAIEVERDTLEGLMLAPISRDLVFLGKALGNLLFLCVAELVVLPIFAVLFNLAVFKWELLVIALLANVGFSTVGTVFAAMSVRVRAREIMLPMLFLPAVAPLLMATVEATAGVVNSRGFSEYDHWIQLAGAFDVIFVVASAFFFQFVLED